MSTRRVVIGKDLSGVFGLKASLPGYDVLTDDENDSNKFSFNSSWPDLVRPHLVGALTVPANSTFFLNPVPFAALPYTPFVECRSIRDGIIRDDWTVVRNNAAPSSTFNYATSGVPFLITNSVLNITISDLDTKVIYVIFRSGF